MLRYAISDRNLFPGSERDRQLQLVRQAVALAAFGVDYFQVREKNLDQAALLNLTCAIRGAVHATGSRMQIVLNGPRALAEHAGVGWHRSSSPLPTSEHEELCLSCSVHTVQDVQAQRNRATLLLFAPVFGKTLPDRTVLPGAGLDALHTAVLHANGTSVLALGGVTPGNAGSCMEAGAAGIAGVRLFLPEAMR